VKRIATTYFVLALGFALGAARAERWQMQYFYDEARTSLALNDLAFPTPQRGVAVGYLAGKERVRGTAVVTSDGGAHWTLVPLPDPGLSVFFLNDTTGWVVTPKGILQTDEGGRSWRKLPRSPKNVLRVWFLDAEHGFAVGIRKAAWETLDGGKKWTRLAVAEQVKSTPEYTVFNTVTFCGPMGMITGASRPPRRDDEEELPDWMVPEAALKRNAWPGLTISLETKDRGKTWQPSTVSIFGRITRVQLSANGLGLGLVEHERAFPYPSEVFAFGWKTGSNSRVYREKERAVTDVALAPEGAAYLAAIEVPGKLVRPPFPSRLHILRSGDLKQWSEMAVDYRASAQRAILAAPDNRNLWVATDTGMILKLVP